MQTFSSKHNYLGITQTCQNQNIQNGTLSPLHPALQILFPINQLCKSETSVLSLYASLVPSIYNQTQAPGDFITNT